MADMDGFREANNFGFGQTSQFDNFHVKGASNYSWGMKDRLSRIFNPKTGRAVMLAFDHGFIIRFGTYRPEYRSPRTICRLYHVYARYLADFYSRQHQQARLPPFGCRFYDPDGIAP